MCCIPYICPDSFPSVPYAAYAHSHAVNTSAPCHGSARNTTLEQWSAIPPDRTGFRQMGMRSTVHFPCADARYAGPSVCSIKSMSSSSAQYARSCKIRVLKADNRKVIISMTASLIAYICSDLFGKSIKLFSASARPSHIHCMSPCLKFAAGAQQLGNRTLRFRKLPVGQLEQEVSTLSSACPPNPAFS